jgi:hypothetical protein
MRDFYREIEKKGNMSYLQRSPGKQQTHYQQDELSAAASTSESQRAELQAMQQQMEAALAHLATLDGLKVQPCTPTHNAHAPDAECAHCGLSWAGFSDAQRIDTLAHMPL